MDLPQTNILDYVVKCRQAGMLDSKIIEALSKSNWPSDIIDQAMSDANSIIASVPETSDAQNPKESAVIEAALPGKTIQSKSNETVEKKDAEKLPKKKFSAFAFIAFILSPIPIIGFFICMIAVDLTQKKKMSGTFLPVIGMIINTAILFYFLYVVFAIILPGDGNLTGFAEAVNNMFKFI